MLSTAVAAAVLVSAGTALLVTGSSRRLRRALPGAQAAPARSTAVELRSWAVRGCRPVVVAPLVALPTGLLAGPAAAAVAALAAALLARGLLSSSRAKTAAQAWTAAGRSIAGLAAELRAGRSPTEALDAVAGSAPPPVAGPLLAAARAARLGADPAAALAEHAKEVPAMAQLAACWRVSARTGAGLAEVADALAEDLRATQRSRGELAVEVSASRASAKLLAGLPMVGIALGASLGARPLHFLLHTTIGMAVLAVGVVFEVIGLLWTDRLIRGVEFPR